MRLARIAHRLIVDSAPLDPAAPLYGAGVLPCSELADWSLPPSAAGATAAAAAIWLIAILHGNGNSDELEPAAADLSPVSAPSWSG